MEKCPNCGEYSIAYDGNRQAFRCMVDGCSCILHDDNAYSILVADPTNNAVNRVKFEGGVEVEVLKRFGL